MQLIVILGQTASGKTALAAQLAYIIQGEIISADSRQIYKGMSIGSGKDLEDYIVYGKRIPYHLIDIRNAGEQYTLYDYQSDFDNILSEIAHRGSNLKETPNPNRGSDLQNHNPHGKIPPHRGTDLILCGGSGLYIETVLGNKTLQNVPMNEELRLALDKLSLEELSQKLGSLRKLHNISDISDRNRCIRAIEIAEYEKIHPSMPRIPPKNLIIGLYIEPKKGCEKIWKRLNYRLENGLIEEVQSLLSFLKPSELLYYGLEYKYLTRYLCGEITKDQMRDELFRAICQFAKRQRTWFRRMEKNGYTIHWINAEEPIKKKILLAQEIIKANP